MSGRCPMCGHISDNLRLPMAKHETTMSSDHAQPSAQQAPLIASHAQQAEQAQLDHHYMQLALVQAQQAAARGEVPVGAVLVAAALDQAPRILAQAHNQPIGAHDPTAHAEIQVIRAAASELNNYRLDGTTLYVTLEPCTMCVGALVHARVARVVFAASEPKAGALQSARALMDAEKSGYFNHRFAWQGGVCEAEAAALLSAFFKQRRGYRNP